MTEEIIIDGVNVAGCEHYTTMEDCDGIHDLCEQLDDYCSIKKNCYYKQYKRLEQENKELKEKKDKYYQQTLDDEILMNELSLEVDLRKKESDFYLEKLSKYRSALEKIREILNKECGVISNAKAVGIINEVLNV